MTVLEVAVLPLRAGTADDFEAAFTETRPLLEAHTEGFRGSNRYPRWRELLHHFHDPFPVVDHDEVVA